jgi:hypothetical protein
MRRLATVACLSAAISVVEPVELGAQTAGKLAVGASISSKFAGASEARGGTGIGFLYRWGHGRQGWGWKYGINWYSAELGRPLGDAQPEFGKLQVRPFLAGYGYTHLIGRTKVSANLMAGYAFTSFRLHDSFDQAYRDFRGVDSIDTSSSNAFVVRPEVSLWYDVNEKIGFNLGAGYVIARPEITVISSLGRDRQRVHADMFSIKAGLVYSIY